MALSTLPGDSSGTVKSIPLSYDISRSEDSARELVTALYPEWASSDGAIDFVAFKDGITNTLFKAVKKRPGFTEQQMDDEAILLRAYGDGTSVLIDRNREAQSHSLLNKYGLAPPLLARFENGLLYRFIPGYACTAEDLSRADVWPSTARLLGSWHGALPTSNATEGSTDNEEMKYDFVKSLIPNKPLPHLWSTLQKWILALPTESQKEKDVVAWLQEELEHTAKIFGSTAGLDNGKYIMSHCDLLSGNVIVRPSDPNSANKAAGLADVSFIDYEYCTPAPSAFDIANHFAEWAGFECDYNLLPTRSQRREFIRLYVGAYRSQSKPETNGSTSNGHSSKSASSEEDLERLMKEVDDFRGLPGLYWGTWGLIQAMISSIDFDYATYADLRLAEYAAWKAEADGSREKKGAEMPLRERRLAQE